MQYSSRHNAVQLRDKNYPSPYQTSQLQASPSTHQASHLQASPSTHQTNHLRDKDLEQRLMKEQTTLIMYLFVGVGGSPLRSFT